MLPYESTKVNLTKIPLEIRLGMIIIQVTYMKQNREPRREVLNRQLGEDLASAFPDGIPDGMTLNELQAKIAEDEVDKYQLGKARNVLNTLKRESNINTVKELKVQNLEDLEINARNLGRKGREFLEGLLGKED